MSNNVKREIKKNKEIVYLQKDFQSFRNELENYSRQHYPDKIIDFSDSSLAGLFLDIAAYVGDNLSFYLDHQFSENFLETAVEPDNIERLIRNAGTEIPGPSPSLSDIDITMIVPAKEMPDGSFEPDTFYLPIVKEGTVFASTKGIDFTLLDNLDFSKKDVNGNFVARTTVFSRNNQGKVLEFEITRTGKCTSAKTYTDIFPINSSYVSFRTLTLNQDDVNEILSVVDENNEEYYEVKSLSQDVVFKRYTNERPDVDLVPERLEIIPAPRRFTKFRTTTSGKTTIQFGAGDEKVLDEDIIPDPSLNAIKLYGDRKVFNEVSIDPNNFLKTNTLGISPRDTSITVRYRAGGGLDNNVSAGQINVVKTLITSFGETVGSFFINKIRTSITVSNPTPSTGGENEPSLEALRNIAILSKNSQERIVTREDFLARVYSMPSNFGRVFRASVSDNPNNPLSAQVYIISRNIDDRLIFSSDTLKENLSIYLNKFRLISDSVDILDAKIINLGINFEITVKKGKPKNAILQVVKNKLVNYFDIENFQIDQPIILGEIENLILNTNGVMSILSLNIYNKTGVDNNKVYSLERFSVARFLDRGLLFPPKGGIFEIRYLLDDIKGKCL